MLGIGLVALVGLPSGTAAWAGPVTSKVVISRKVLKPGVVLVHSRILVRGVMGAIGGAKVPNVIFSAVDKEMEKPK